MRMKLMIIFDTMMVIIYNCSIVVYSLIIFMDSIDMSTAARRARLEMLLDDEYLVA